MLKRILLVLDNTKPIAIIPWTRKGRKSVRIFEKYNTDFTVLVTVFWNKQATIEVEYSLLYGRIVILISRLKDLTIWTARKTFENVSGHLKVLFIFSDRKCP